MNESMIGHEMVLTRYIYIYIGNSNIRKKQPDIFISWGNSSSAEQTTLKGNFEFWVLTRWYIGINEGVLTHKTMFHEKYALPEHYKWTGS